ncbi:hypothetical protein HYFRA_00012610 [Hymenoscyphus fraxineus]|uniref:Protein kinase domain-containing protein n=1 Tax=Hymenoscyphus fraxineus TaxID=746836 RepID=A0A9N9L841_9HELO|nr:hypothetical protein HYFRA_00012610 [Hymenoscyphus fraxineus]
MSSLEARNSAFNQETWDQLQKLCCKPSDPAGVISDEQFESIAACLRYLENHDASYRPRTYAILHMMNRVDLLISFVVVGLLDNSLPYADRKSLPPLMRGDADACFVFLELQTHVISAACYMEKGEHMLVESGDNFFDTLERLGSGGEAKVHRVRSRMTKQEYARKRFHRQRDLNGGKRILKGFEKELQILRKLDHTHLVKVFASYTDKRYLAILMKPIADQDLKQYLRYCGGKSLIGLERERFRTYYGCLTSAIAYLHDNNIRHKDIKPNNILLKRDEIYITDFGTAIEFDDDKSETRGTVEGRTVRYQSPEVSRGLPRGKPSDLWSLGVTFLEMTTVLRGQSLDDMQAFLAEHGTCEEYVFGNIQGAMQWMEFLRRTAQPRVDNSPMQWMKDMLEEKAKDRPTAPDLFQSIKQAADGIFCNKCCHSDGSFESDTSSDSENSDFEKDDETIRPAFISTLKSNNELEPQFAHPSDEGLPTLEVAVNPVNNPQPSSRSPIHKQAFKLLYSYFSGSSIPAEDESLPGTETQRPDMPSPVVLGTLSSTVQGDNTIFESPAVYDPYERGLPGSFPEFTSSENPSQYIVPEAADASQGIKSTTDIANDQSIDFGSSPQSIPELGTNLNESSESLPEENDQTFFKSYVSPSCDPFEESVAVEDSLYNPPEDAVTQIQAASNLPVSELQTLLSQNNRRLSRTRSDENLQIQQKTNALLSAVEAHGEDTHTQSRSRRNRNEDRHGITLHVANEFDIAKVRKWKSNLDALVNTTVPSISPAVLDDTTPEARHSIPSERKRAKSKKSTTSSINHKGRVDEPKVYLDQNNTEEIVDETRPIPKLTKRRGLDTPINCSSPAVVVVPRPKTNPLKGWFSQVRSPPEAQKTNALTSENLDFLGKETSSRKQKAHPTFKIKSASVYMKQVYNDAASSVATSVMSTNTRKSMKLYGLMLPLQDRSYNLLERYTKAGKADAVRMLLREGCSPGTVKEPRHAPIFHTVRGASSRHTKCLRALIEHQVDTNVRARSTRKTPLIEAIEQEAWSGYVNVIFLLLAAGAKPNAKDGAGDVALLKVLGAGKKPLEKHRRAALALLLSTAYDTNVNVTPLGTGNNPLHLAVRRVDPWALGMLLEKDSTLIEAKNSEGLTPLSLACSAWTSTITPGQLEILDVLLEKKANVNVNITARAKKPLHTAVSLGLVDAVERLLRNGADPLKRTRDGETARDMAKERRKQHGCKGCADCTEISDLLVKESLGSGRDDG